MSRGLIALSVTAVVTAGIIAFVHYDQKRELRRMREGVYLDAERERYRRQVLNKEISRDNEISHGSDPKNPNSNSQA